MVFKKIAFSFASVLVASGYAQDSDAEGVGRVPRQTAVAGDEAYILGFDILAGYKYTIVDLGTGATEAEIEEAKRDDQVPSWVRFYDDKRVVLTGYMLPLEIEGGLSKRFIMMKDINTCCYGSTPSMNDYAIVTMKGKGVKTVQDVPVEIVGDFVIDQNYQDGYVVSLYLVDGEAFLGEKK